MPKVSVIIPAHRCGDHIQETINSVLSQTYNCYEIIVVDSGVDNTRQILAQYIDKVKYFYQPQKGVSAARNLGMAKASGEYIAFLDGDDIWDAAKLQTQMTLIKTNADIDFVFSDGYSFVDKNKIRKSLMISQEGPSENRFLSWVFHQKYNNGAVWKGNMCKYLILDNFIFTSTAIMKRKIMQKIGEFNENLQLSEDYDYWLRASMHFNFMYVNTVTAGYRIHGDGLSGEYGIREFRHRKAVAIMFENNKTMSNFEHSDQIKKRICNSYRIAAWGYLKQRDFVEARHLSIRSLSYNKLQAKLYIYILVSFFPRFFLKLLKAQ